MTYYKHNFTYYPMTCTNYNKLIIIPLVPAKKCRKHSISNSKLNIGYQNGRNKWLDKNQNISPSYLESKLHKALNFNSKFQPWLVKRRK